jgi:hypothetical protein
MKAHWRYAVLALVLCVSPAACERTEKQSTSHPERQGTGQYAAQNECPAAGNSATRIYHLPGDRNYGQMLEENKDKKRNNLVCFNSRAEAEMDGYRRARSGKNK